MTAKEVLQKYWQYDAFRKPQEEIIQAVLNQKNVLALLPTGGGKSLCYQIPGLLQKGVCIVVSPLIALMQDQVLSLEKKGIKAIAITSKLSEKEIVTAFDNMLYGNIKFLYLSPEKLQSTFIQSKIKQLQINLIAVDEAHCISEWGHDFRSSYLKINILKDLLPTVNIIALTATATKIVEQDIIHYLDLKQVQVFKESFVRSNLAYQVYKTEAVSFKVKQMLKKIQKPTILYVYTRKQTKEWSDYLNQQNFAATYYHGGMTSNEKELSYTNWISEKTPIMVATNAFGMGIDKGNVKLVVHLSIPRSIENYMQEAGRAGRDGTKSFAVLLYNDATIHSFTQQIDKSIISISFLKEVYFYLNQHFRVANGEMPEQRFVLDLPFFCMKYHLDVVQTYNAIMMLDREGVLQFETDFQIQSTVQFICSNRELLRYEEDKFQLKDLIHSLLRLYGGIFDNSIFIDEYILAKKLQVSKQKIVQLLQVLKEDHIINYHKKNTVSAITFLVMREDDRVINRISKSVHKRNALKLEKKETILHYIQNETVCRSIQLLQYFDEQKNEKCGYCDVCLQEKKVKPNFNKIQNAVLTLLQDKGSLNAKEIILELLYYEQDIIETIQFLLENDKIILNKKNQYAKK